MKTEGFYIESRVKQGFYESPEVDLLNHLETD